MAPLAGRAAIVTGAATGIGRAIAWALAQAGAAVIVNHLDTPEKASALVDEIGSNSGRARAVQGDVSRFDDFEQLVAAAHEAFGRWDVLVNNAAVARTKPLSEFSEAEIDRMFAVNVKGPIWGCQLAEQRMSADGRVINISSSTTRLMLPGYEVYDATKAATDQLTRIFSRQLAERGITVNSISPGATATESYAAGRGEELVSRFAAMSPFGRLGEVDEIADVVTFLAGPGSRWITAQNILVNGGTV
jgi:3-oxoacyl-[acyl-carrier protein] reductase